MKALFPFHYIPVKPLVQGRAQARKQNSASFHNPAVPTFRRQISHQCELFLISRASLDKNDNILL